MFKFISDAFLSIFLEKEARQKLEQRRAQKKLSQRDQKVRELEVNVDRVMTPERKELIRHAMAARNAKAKILDDLKDEDKQKLYALAIKNLLREDDGNSDK
ncbi:MAG: hypothetical protein OEY85_01830 [Rhodospirillales bacterium]|nr:hypothetical protein [Rhodospirillales bacterium]